MSEQEHKEEAERLALLPVEMQRQIIDLHRSVADNLKIKKRDRDIARERADTLERLLGLAKKSRKKL